LAETSATYFVDAGDALFKSPYVVKSKREHLLEVAGAIIGAYNVMGCTAMNVGMNDLAAGLDFITEMQAKANFPFLSSNILHAETQKPLFQASAIIETPDLKLGLVGVTIGDKRLKEFTFANPIESAQKEINAIKDQVDLIFLLANVDDVMEKDLMNVLEGIDFLVRSKTGAVNRNPKEQNGVVLIRNGNQGKYAGVLQIRKVDDTNKLTNVSAQHTRIDFADKRLASMAEVLEEGQALEQYYAGDDKRLELINRLKDEKNHNEDLIKKLKNSYYFEAIALDDKVPDTPEVAPIVAKYMPKKKDAKVKKTGKKVKKK